MIYIELTKEQFIGEFQKSERRDQFSKEALEALYDHHVDCGLDYPFDILMFCCGWDEYGSEEDLWGDFGKGVYSVRAFDDLLEKMRQRTTILELASGSYLVQDHKWED